LLSVGGWIAFWAGSAHPDLTPRTQCCHLSGVISLTIQLDLPEALVKEAQANGLLESKRLEELLRNELRRARARKEFGDMLDHVRSQPGEPMSVEEIQAEVNVVREQRRRRESGR